MNQYSIFDIDNTLVDSSHRQCTNADGTLNLAHWIENNTPELIQKDALLPCINTIRNDYKAGNIIVLCTARVLSDADYEFFMENDIPFHHMLDRPQGCLAKDADLKEFHLRLFAHNIPMSWARFCATSLVYDDARSVLVRLNSIGMNTVDAVLWNRDLKRMGRIA